MKTLIQYTAVLLLLSIIMTKAQTSQVPASVSAAFSKEFSAASNVQWTVTKDIYQSRFEQGDEKLIAYFNQDGTLVATARKIQLSQAPTLVRKSISVLQDQYEAASPAEMYEISEANDTQYFVNVTGKKQFISALASVNGNCKVLRKSNKPLTADQSDILAQMR